MSDQEKHDAITLAVGRRAPALMFARSMGVPASAEEALFLSVLVDDEAAKLGLPEGWYLVFAMRQHDAAEAKTRPYKCARCGQRYSTSNKRNACHSEKPTKIESGAAPREGKRDGRD